MFVFNLKRRIEKTLLSENREPSGRPRLAIILDWGRRNQVCTAPNYWIVLSICSAVASPGKVYPIYWCCWRKSFLSFSLFLGTERLRRRTLPRAKIKQNNPTQFLPMPDSLHGTGKLRATENDDDDITSSDQLTEQRRLQGQTTHNNIVQQFAKVVALSRLHKDHMISRVQILELVLELFVIYAVDNVGRYVMPDHH